MMQFEMILLLLSATGMEFITSLLFEINFVSLNPPHRITLAISFAKLTASSVGMTDLSKSSP